MFQRALILSAALFLAACSGPLKVVEGLCRPKDPNAPKEDAVCRQPATQVRTLLAGSAEVRMDSRCHWFHTGVQLEKGAKYRITAKEPPVEGWVDWFNPSHPRSGWDKHRWYEGLVRPFSRASNVPMYALAGVEGQDTGEYFPAIGEERQATGKGELLLFANDWYYSYWNNKGCLDVKVERVN